MAATPDVDAVRRPVGVPLLAAATYLACSTTLTLANKYIFSHQTFNYPWMTLATQSTVVVACLSAFQISRRAITFSPALFRQLLIPCLLFTLYLFSNARAMRHLPLPILSVMKSLAPMGIALAENGLYGDAISRPVAGAMLLIVVSNGMTLGTAPPSSSTSYFWALFNVVINIAHVLSLRFYLSSSFTPVEKTLHSNMIASFMFLPFAVINGEIKPFFRHLSAASGPFLVVFALSCILAAAIGASIFWVVQQTSGSTLSFVGACNKFPVVVLSALIFQDKISHSAWLSVFVGVSAGVVFAIAKSKEKESKELKGKDLKSPEASAFEPNKIDSTPEALTIEAGDSKDSNTRP